MGAFVVMESARLSPGRLGMQSRTGGYRICRR
jgi:hypothetical protein